VSLKLRQNQEIVSLQKIKAMIKSSVTYNAIALKPGVFALRKPLVSNSAKYN
jgi:hypothetical protein